MDYEYNGDLRALVIFGLGSGRMDSDLVNAEKDSIAQERQIQPLHELHEEEKSTQHTQNCRKRKQYVYSIFPNS